MVVFHVRNSEIIKCNIDDLILWDLKENVTTGYRWLLSDNEEVESLKSNYIKFISEDFFSDNPQLIGSGGTVRFEFKAIKRGKTEIEIFYRRPWEKTLNDKSEILSIIIT